MRLRFPLATSCLLAFASLAPSLVNAGAWVPGPKDRAIDFTGSFYSADDFHTTNGTRTTLAGGGLYEERAFAATAELGWKPNMSFLMRVPFQSVTRRLADDAGAAEATSMGFGDMTLGLRYRISQSESQAVSAEFDWKAPLGYDAHVRLNQATIDDLDANYTDGLSPGDSANFMRQVAPPRLGEGQQDLTGLVRYGRSMAGWRSYADLAAGYRYRFDDPSDQIVLKADLGFWATNRILLLGRYDGTIAVGDGTTTADEYQEQLVGPEITVRVDEGIDVFVGSWHTAGAENPPHKDQFYVGFMLKQTGLNRYQGNLGGTKPH